MAHVSEKKKKIVAEFVQLLDQYPVIGTVNMANLPTKQLQNMRKKLREKGTVLRMTKKRLMKQAFAIAKKKNIADLQKHLEGMPALIFTEENPFKLYAGLQKTKSKAPAKTGQTAPNDIVVSAGATTFTPGPIISELGKFGIKSGIESGKVVIKEDSIVAKKGDIISEELASILGRLGLEPMDIGLNLTSVYEEGEIYESEVLHIDLTEYTNKFTTSYIESLNLSVYTGYPTTDSLPLLITKAHSEARNLALSENIVTPDTTEDLLRKAQAHSISLSNSLSQGTIPDAPIVETPEVQEVEQKQEKENKIEEPKKDEDIAVGLGSLFG